MFYDNGWIILEKQPIGCLVYRFRLRENERAATIAHYFIKTPLHEINYLP